MNLYFVSLGCDKNLVDSKKMIDRLSAHHYHIVDDVKKADVAIVNTCCFIQSATEESIETILEMAREKETGFLKAIVMAGCMAERYRDQISQELPEVDALIDTHSIENICDMIDSLAVDQDSRHDESVSSAALLTPGYYGYLKIADGCDKCCTYCVIPSIRGAYKSVPISELVAEARKMAEDGVRELILVAQETTLYGTDLYGRKMLPELLEQLCLIDGIEWIRLLYCYPEEITDDLIQCMASHHKICHYIDMPIQHADDVILKRMGRKTTQSQIRDVTRRLREAMPDIAIRTTLIAGFPGETEAQHQTACSFIREMKYDRVGIFSYSQEDGTPASRMDSQIRNEIKEIRRQALYEAQQEVVFQANMQLQGSQLDVLIEGALADSPGIYAGRTYRDAPQVDGLIFVNSRRTLYSGDIVRTVITGASGYDLTGEELS